MKGLAGSNKSDVLDVFDRCVSLRPDSVSLRVQIQASVGLNHGVFNGGVGRPHQRQHLPHPADGVGDAKLAHRHTKLHGLLDHWAQSSQKM